MYKSSHSVIYIMLYMFLDINIYFLKYIAMIYFSYYLSLCLLSIIVESSLSPSS